MSSKRVCITATARLKQDYLRIMRDPVPYVTALPLPSNILEWRYIVFGPENTPYEGGIYHGKLVFPSEFPFKPPSIYMITPNGRFKTNTRLCLSISDFHPDTWNPAWSVSTILTGLLSFMVETSQTLGSIETSEYEKRRLAAHSGTFNLKDKVFTELFQEIAEEIRGKIEKQREQEAIDQQQQKGLTSNTLTRKTTMTEAQQHAAQNGGIGGALTNMFMLVGFAAFAYTVKYVLCSLAQ
ncbi:PREDICTED: ubiquitin-conjugating enzyme E2 J2-like [Priapulus caudatus]|uniref:Ubiquitin-conjugating enzyme E2 J2-like n=1 Tax=Priapulus caudatus TaxID=37621 RepID=A0ABM1DYB8_PRICU|nr:PREDICTED: ubiquitin-conjugating enzyme E2 J2-like [Priapulus caudatus]XP_014664940.1 PREDICTED: ubiquitin-conjugating enzyme E2 J2-like [Priapulus caudatus]